MSLVFASNLFHLELSTTRFVSIRGQAPVKSQVTACDRILIRSPPPHAVPMSQINIVVYKNTLLFILRRSYWELSYACVAGISYQIYAHLYSDLKCNYRLIDCVSVGYSWGSPWKIACVISPYILNINSTSYFEIWEHHIQYTVTLYCKFTRNIAIWVWF